MWCFWSWRLHDRCSSDPLSRVSEIISPFFRNLWDLQTTDSICRRRKSDFLGSWSIILQIYSLSIFLQNISKAFFFPITFFCTAWQKFCCIFQPYAVFENTLCSFIKFTSKCLLKLATVMKYDILFYIFYVIEGILDQEIGWFIWCNLWPKTFWAKKKNK